MRRIATTRGVCQSVAAVASLLGPAGVLHAAPSTVDDRITVGFNGESLTHTNGGGGGALGWLHNFNADALAGVGVEYQSLANAHWTFGSVSGAYTFGPGDTRYSVYGEAHEGAGNSGNRHIHYRTEVLGGIVTLSHRLSLQLEGKHVDIDTVHGYLPKLGVSYLWNPHVQTALSYSYSVGPNNLGTRLTSGRLDIYGHRINFLGGFSFGQATAAVLSYVSSDTTTNIPGLTLREGYVGATLPLPSLRSEVTLILDYQHLSSRIVSGSNRFQGNLNYVFHVGHHGT